MFERTSDAIRYLCETTYHICQSGVMSTTLVVHYNTIPVKKQSTCHSGVMPTTLQQYLWRYNPHFTQVWCHPHYNNTCEDTTHMLLRCDATHTTTIPVKNNPHVTLVWLHPHYNNTCEEKSTCHSGVMPPTLQQYLWRTTHMSLWCDDTHTTTIPVKKHSTCHSGVMPPTLHTCDETTHMSLWCDDTHTTTIPVKKQSTCHSGVMPPTLHTCEETTHMSLWCDANHTTNYLWRNNPHVTQVWCHPHYIPVKKQPTCHSGVMQTTLQTTCEETIHMSLALVWRHLLYNNICEETFHKSPRCDALDSEYQQPRKIYHLLLCVKTLLQSRRHRHNIFCVINPHNTSERRIYIFVMFRALNVTLTETYAFIKAWRLQGRCNRHNLCDINSQNTTTWEGTIYMLLLWCSVRQTLHHQKHIPSFLCV